MQEWHCLWWAASYSLLPSWKGGLFCNGSILGRRQAQKLQYVKAKIFIKLESQKIKRARNETGTLKR